MELLPHAIAWCKGEIFEGRIVLLFGVVVTLSAVLFYTVGTTPASKAMFYPLLITGILFIILSGGMMYNNPKRIVAFTQAAQEDPKAFVASEKARTETFISWYPISRYVSAGLGILGIALFLFSSAPIGRAIAISLFLIAIAVFVVDHFSEERAGIYYEKILEAS